ncbi:MAG: hypothetical protein KDA77_20160, partial [Planctomycetaceae bacterium]|nr:hypothetical protein [Planctomycetaceae bacterium]
CWFAAFELNQKSQSDAGRGRKFRLAQALSLARVSNDLANIFWCHMHSFPSGKYGIAGLQIQ